MGKGDQEVKGIWKYLHHLISGVILLAEGILLFVLDRSIIFALFFTIIGLILFIDDLLAETVGRSLFNNLHSDPVRLKIAGILFFIIMEILFALIIIGVIP